MNNNFTNNENLLYNLPDYIAGKITDKNLIQRIKSEIDSNPDFKSEYELISETFSSVNNLKFSEPPEHYFSNLVPRINARIEKQNNKSPFLHFFRISNLLKYALPAISVVLIIVIINYSNKNKKDENMFIQSDHTINNIMNNKSDTTTDSINNLKKQLEEESNKETNENNLSTEVKEVNNPEKISTKNKQEKVTEENNSGILELFTESEETEEEYYYESDFSSLSQSEQNELLNKLSNTNF